MTVALSPFRHTKA